METFSKHCRFILTCNYVERVIDPIQSRCQSYKITPPTKSDVARHTVDILNNEGVEYDLDDIAVVITAGYPDIRRVINSLQKQVVNNKLSIDESSIIQSNYKLQLIELLTSKAPLNDIRQLVANNSLSDYSELYRLLYDNVHIYSKNNVPECILAIAEGQHQDVNVVDKEINFIATILKIQEIVK